MERRANNTPYDPREKILDFMRYIHGQSLVLKLSDQEADNTPQDTDPTEE